MRRSVSWLVLSAGLFAPLFTAAGDKLPDQSLQADAREDVSEALIAESSGDNAERSKRLTKAWLAVPDLPEANWHLARVRIADQWQPLAEVVSHAAQDPDQEQYRALRERAAGNAKAQRELARWCTKRDWHDRARLHYAQLLADPKADASSRAEAVEKLNLVQVNGAWITSDEAQSRQQEGTAIQESLANWRPRLKAIQVVIDGDDFAQRDKAIADLAKLDDRTMIPALESFLLDGRADFQEQAVRKLAQFEEVEATESLTRFAVLSESSIVRSQAIESLRERPLQDYCPILLDALESPLVSRYQINVHRNGQIQYVHVVARETAAANEVLAIGRRAFPVRSFLPPTGNPVPFIEPVESAARRTARTIDTAASKLHASVVTANARKSEQNRRLTAALEGATQQGLGDEATKWRNWWQTYNEVYWPKPTKYIYSHKTTNYGVHTRVSCFLAGTPVRTELGTLPIESIKAGDRVLAQDQDSGELSYKVVLTTTLRPPAKMMQIQAGGEDIYTTLGHPFWVSGQGWKMAKQLKAGDLLHGLGGATPITAITPAGEHEAHNLVVDDDNTYFVGRAGLLVHDNELRKPTRAVVPGLTRE